MEPVDAVVLRPGGGLKSIPFSFGGTERGEGGWTTTLGASGGGVGGYSWLAISWSLSVSFSVVSSPLCSGLIGGEIVNENGGGLRHANVRAVSR